MLYTIHQAFFFEGKFYHPWVLGDDDLGRLQQTGLHHQTTAGNASQVRYTAKKETCKILIL